MFQSLPAARRVQSRSMTLFHILRHSARGLNENWFRYWYICRRKFILRMKSMLSSLPYSASMWKCKVEVTFGVVSKEIWKWETNQWCRLSTKEPESVGGGGVVLDGWRWAWTDWKHLTLSQQNVERKLLFDDLEFDLNWFLYFYPWITTGEIFLWKARGRYDWEASSS
jgi:hypothetical protein